MKVKDVQAILDKFLPEDDIVALIGKDTHSIQRLRFEDNVEVQHHYLSFQDKIEKELEEM